MLQPKHQNTSKFWRSTRASTTCFPKWIYWRYPISRPGRWKIGESTLTGRVQTNRRWRRRKCLVKTIFLIIYLCFCIERAICCCQMIRKREWKSDHQKLCNTSSHISGSVTWSPASGGTFCGWMRVSRGTSNISPPEW